MTQPTPPTMPATQRDGPSRSAGSHVAERRREQIGRQPLDLNHRQAPQRQARHVSRPLDPRDRQRAADPSRGTAHDGDIADHHAAGRGARVVKAGDDLRADAAGVAHRQRDRQPSRHVER